MAQWPSFRALTGRGNDADSIPDDCNVERPQYLWKAHRSRAQLAGIGNRVF